MSLTGEYATGCWLWELKALRFRVFLFSYLQFSCEFSPSCSGSHASALPLQVSMPLEPEAKINSPFYQSNRNVIDVSIYMWMLIFLCMHRQMVCLKASSWKRKMETEKTLGNVTAFGEVNRSQSDRSSWGSGVLSKGQQQPLKSLVMELHIFRAYLLKIKEKKKPSV